MGRPLGGVLFERGPLWRAKRSRAGGAIDSVQRSDLSLGLSTDRDAGDSTPAVDGEGVLNFPGPSGSMRPVGLRAPG